MLYLAERLIHMFQDIYFVLKHFLFVSSISVCNHAHDCQIRLTLRGRPILLITRMITDRIGLNSVLLPLLAEWKFPEVSPVFKCLNFIDFVVDVHRSRKFVVSKAKISFTKNFHNLWEFFLPIE